MEERYGARPVQLDQQSVGRLARMDALQRQAMASETLRRRARRRQQLLQALKRMDEGEFGYCSSCGEEIPEARLDIDPAFHLCVKCAA
jgi:DnaK suppressor protein